MTTGQSKIVVGPKARHGKTDSRDLAPQTAPSRRGGLRALRPVLLFPLILGACETSPQPERPGVAPTYLPFDVFYNINEDERVEDVGLITDNTLGAEVYAIYDANRIPLIFLNMDQETILKVPDPVPAPQPLPEKVLAALPADIAVTDVYLDSIDCYAYDRGDIILPITTTVDGLLTQVCN